MKAKRNKKTIVEYIGAGLDLPLESISSVPVIEIKGDAEFVLDGCESIKSYSPDKVTLITNEYTVDIYGVDLSIGVFAENKVVLRGRVTKVEFGDEAL
jgi:sporulation protein YqfC